MVNIRLALHLGSSRPLPRKNIPNIGKNILKEAGTKKNKKM
jgi:hypothetical protein